MIIVKETISLIELKKMAAGLFGNIVKAVVDVEQEIMAVDADLHSDQEALLLSEGSKQSDLWGINIYPELQAAERIEFDSMINLKPSQNNRTRGVDDPEIRSRIIKIANKLINK